MLKNRRAIVALSGGVDSAVSAYLLKQAGYSVVGLFMKSWEEEEGACPAEEDALMAGRIAELLEIPFYPLNFTADYRERVFAAYLRDLEAGLTPNPDTLCNREIKFSLLLEKAQELGGDLLATGHYARIEERRLLKGKDPEKDQSYFLYALPQKALESCHFPVGAMKKQEVRALARTLGFPNDARRSSRGICFIGKRPMRPFLSRYLPLQEGAIVDVEGKELGRHPGIAYFTIGQRKGLFLGGMKEPYFVVEKDIPMNRLIVAMGENHPALFKSRLTVRDLYWLTPPTTKNLNSKIRYRQEDQACTLEGDAVTFAKPQRAVTPGQAIVFYDGEVCLGGGTIATTS